MCCALELVGTLRNSVSKMWDRKELAHRPVGAGEVAPKVVQMTE